MLNEIFLLAFCKLCDIMQLSPNFEVIQNLTVSKGGNTMRRSSEVRNPKAESKMEPKPELKVVPKPEAASEQAAATPESGAVAEGAAPVKELATSHPDMC